MAPCKITIICALLVACQGAKAETWACSTGFMIYPPCPGPAGTVYCACPNNQFCNCTSPSSPIPDVGCTGTCAPLPQQEPECRMGGNIIPIDCPANSTCQCTGPKPTNPDVACLGTCIPTQQEPECRMGGNIMPIDCPSGYACQCTGPKPTHPDFACIGTCKKKVEAPKLHKTCRQGGNIKPLACPKGYKCANCTVAQQAGHLVNPDAACMGTCLKKKKKM